MAAEPHIKSDDPSPSLSGVTDEITIAADLVGVLYMAANHLTRREANAVAQTASIATDHLVKAIRMIEAIMARGEE